MAAVRNDINRTGFFSEEGYTSINDPYVTNKKFEFNQAAAKGKQMLPGGSKTRNASMAGYFDKKFNRTMEGEAYDDPVKRRRKERIAAKALNVGNRAFLPTHTGKALGGQGNFYGTFSGTVGAFSRVARPRAKYVSPLKNVLVNPAKKGTFGYRGICIGADQTYASEPYEKARDVRNVEAKQHKTQMVGKAFHSDLHPKDLFDKNPFGSDRPLPPEKSKSAPVPIARPFILGSTGKKAGGGNYGCFTAYPSHSDEKYKPLPGEFRNMKTGANVFKDSQPAKSTNCRSTVNQYVDKKINRQTYQQGTAALSAS